MTRTSSNKDSQWRLDWRVNLRDPESARTGNLKPSEDAFQRGGEVRQGEAQGTALAIAVRGVRQQGDRATLHRTILGPSRVRCVPLRRLRERALRLSDKVRLRNGMAEFLGTYRSTARPREGGSQFAVASDRGRMRQLRFAPGTRVRRRARADGHEVLHQLRLPQVPTHMTRRSRGPSATCRGATEFGAAQTAGLHRPHGNRAEDRRAGPSPWPP